MRAFRFPEIEVLPDGTVQRTAECERCHKMHSWTEASVRKMCRPCAKDRKREQDDARKANRRTSMAGGSKSLRVLDDNHAPPMWLCAQLPRPCAQKWCRLHLGTDIGPTCARDVANGGGANGEEIGRLLNLSRERVKQIAEEAIGKLRSNPAAMAVLRDFWER